MNSIFLIGNLVKDPEIKMTSTGKKVASFSLAIRDGKDAQGNEITQYFNCTAWEKLADILQNYVKKGHKLAVRGSLKNRSWDKPDGTKGYATDILVNDIEMLTSKVDADRISQAPTGTTPKAPSNNSQDLPEIDVDSINVQMPF